MRKIVQIILITIILSVSGHVFISNIEHIVYLNTKTYTIDFQDNASTKNIKKSIQNIEQNLYRIERLKNSYLSYEELNSIKQTLYQYLEKSKNLPFLTYDYTKNIMNETEFYEVIKSTTDYTISELVSAYKTIAKYREDLDVNDFTQNALMQLVYPDFIARDIIENYKYPTSNDYNIAVNIKPLAIINYVAIRLNTVEYISNLVLESGDVNE